MLKRAVRFIRETSAETFDIVRDKWGWGVALALGALVVYRLPADIRARLNPYNWGAEEWAPTILLVLILVSVWALGGFVQMVSGRVDQSWEEVDALRGEVGTLTERVHEQATEIVALKAARLEPRTDPIGLPAQTIERAPTTVLPAQPIFQEPAPTTVTGIPSARPPVPPVAHGSTRSDLWDEAPRGRHAAND